MAKPTKQQVKDASVGQVFTWGLSPTYKIEVKEYVYVADGVEYARNDGFGRESGVVIMCSVFGLE